MTSDDYTRTFSFSATLRGEPLRVISKAGLSDGATVGAAATLAATLITPHPDEMVLLLGCGHGALGVALARLLPNGRLTLSDPSIVALRMAGLTLAANEIAGVTISEQVSHLPAGAGRFDRLVLLAPQSRSLGRRWLVEAHALLRVGGTLNLAGANSGGIKPLIADAAALFGAAHTLGYGQGCRVAEALRRADAPAAPAWATTPGIAVGTWQTLRVDLPTGPVELVSLPGIFSYDRLDDGTALLLAQLGSCAGLRVLDAGCGYGPLGLEAARQGAAQVDLLDASLLAVAAARENIARLELSGAVAEPSDALEAATGRRYDLVLSNPPFHAGKAVDRAMAEAFIAQAQRLLAPRGRLLLVANRFLPYERQMAPHFTQVTTLTESKAYKVLLGARV